MRNISKSGSPDLVTSDPLPQPEAALQRGLALHALGRFDEARVLYEVALQAPAQQFKALHLLGLIAFQTQQPQRAVDLLDQAISISPQSAPVHNDRGSALLELKRYEAAIASYEAAIALNPHYADAHYNRATALLDLAQHEAAVAGYDAAIACQADHTLALNNRGLALCGLGRFEAALESFDRAIAADPGNVESYHFRGNALRDLKRHAAAVASYDQALALEPDDAEIHNGRGSALADLKRFQEALASYDRAIALKADFAEAYSNRGNVWGELERWEEALASYERAIALKPGFAEAYFNRGNVLKELGQWEAALASYDQAIAINGQHADAYCNRGLLLQEQQRLEAALGSFDRAIAIKPEYAQAHVNRSMALLLSGDFERGWAEYEWRRRLSDGPFQQEKRNYAQPYWLGGESLAGKVVLLYGEQGLGDTLQFCRYVKWVAERGARVILEVPQSLRSLLTGLEGAAQVLAAGDTLPAFDYYCSLLSLPLALKTTLSTIPAQVPYLRSDPQKRREWRERLGETRQRRVGLVWSGGFRANQPELWSLHHRRNIPLAKLAALKQPDVEFYSLQKGQPAESELSGLIAQPWDGPLLVDPTPLLHDFSDTAALIEQLDLIISVDTSTAHLAAALGKPVWLLNRYDSCWRWLLDRADSPWYPTLRLYRQERPGDWDGVIDRVRRDLGTADVIKTSHFPPMIDAQVCS
jgi:tetratricopeptide (TPR) repeat protein